MKENDSPSSEYSQLEDNDIDIPGGLVGGKVDLYMIRSDGQSSFHPISPINTNNSIAVWYALKTTIDYLKNRSQIKISDKEKKRLDKAAEINLHNISEYLGDDFDSNFKKNQSEILDDDINTNKNNDLNINNENIQQNRPVATMSELEKILKSQAGQAGVDNELKKYNNYLEFIESDVFNELIKEEASFQNKNNINNSIDNGDDGILLVKKDFDDLKQKLTDPKKSDSDLDTNNIPDDHKKDYETRDEKVFLSKAAKEFKDKVSKLDNVKKSNERDQKVEDYNTAVEKLNNAIIEAVKEKIKEYYNSIMDGYDANKLSDILHKLGLDSMNENDIDGNNVQSNNNNNKKKKKKKGKNKNKNNNKELLDDNTLDKSFENITNSAKNGYISGNAVDDFLSQLSTNVKKKLVICKNNGERTNYINTFLPKDHQESVSKELSEFTTKLKSLSEKDKSKVLLNGNKIEKKENKGDNENVSDLKAIANDKELEKITLGYDEYNEFVATGLFQNVTDIGKCMEGFLSDLLLEDQKGDKFKKAKGQLDGIALQLNKELGSNNANKDNNANKSLKQILSLGFGQCALGNKKGQKEQKFFVPTFIERLFKFDSAGNLNALAGNLETLSKDKNFQSLLSNIMEDEFAVEMIKKNFEETTKSFEDADYKVTRKGKFKEEFWDNNLKAMIPFVGRWSGMDEKRKNFAMILGSLLTGLPIGIIITSVFGLSLFGGTLQAILTSLIIIATIIAIAALISLIITLVKGIKDLIGGRGFYKAGTQDEDYAKTAKQALWRQIYNAFLTLGADTKTLEELVRKKDNDRTQAEKKFLNSMTGMKDFLERHRPSYPQQTTIFHKNSPFDKIKNALKVPDMDSNKNLNKNSLE